MLSLRSLPVWACLAVMAMAVPARMKLCRDLVDTTTLDGITKILTDNKCVESDISPDAFSGIFLFDQAALTNALGGAASAAQIFAELGVVCRFGNHIVKDGFNGDKCLGDKLGLEPFDGIQNFPGGLNDNLVCVQCFKDLV